MYDELLKWLRSEAIYLPGKFSKNAELLDVLMKAADAIEELTGFVQEAERDRDEYRERLDKANDAIEELQKHVPKVPHGRLIDADALDDAFTDLRWENDDYKSGALMHWGDRSHWCLVGGEVENLINAAPTIIPAKEGE